MPMMSSYCHLKWWPKWGNWSKRLRTADLDHENNTQTLLGGEKRQAQTGHKHRTQTLLDGEKTVDNYRTGGQRFESALCRSTFTFPQWSMTGKIKALVNQAMSVRLRISKIPCHLSKRVGLHAPVVGRYR